MNDDYNYTVDEIVISTRLFILRALWKQTLTDTTYTDQTLDEVTAILKILTTTIECRFVLCMLAVSTIARIINDDVVYKGVSVLSPKDISNMGIQACRIILDESKGNIKERETSIVLNVIYMKRGKESCSQRPSL